jgi:hypothetical protein
MFFVTGEAFPVEVKKGLKARVDAGLWTKERYEEAISITGPEFIGPFVAYLATDEARYITGSVFQVAGGHVGLYSVPQEISTIDKKEGMWTVDELARVIPEQLLKDYKNFAES